MRRAAAARGLRRHLASGMWPVRYNYCRPLTEVPPFLSRALIEKSLSVKLTDERRPARLRSFRHENNPSPGRKNSLLPTKEPQPVRINPETEFSGMRGVVLNIDRNSKACGARGHSFSYTWSEAKCVVRPTPKPKRVKHAIDLNPTNISHQNRSCDSATARYIPPQTSALHVAVSVRECTLAQIPRPIRLP